MRGLVRVRRCLGVAGVIALLACGGGGGGGGGIEGEYVLQMGESSDEAMTLELSSDGKAVMSMPGMPPVQGAHSMEGGKLVVVLNGDRDVYTVGADGNLTNTEMGEAAVLIKQ